jgi:hypothetical protein
VKNAKVVIKIIIIQGPSKGSKVPESKRAGTKMFDEKKGQFQRPKMRGRSKNLRQKG